MSSPRQSSRVLITLAAFVIVVAGMRAAEPLLTPFLLSALIAMICTPPLFWLQQKKVPTGLAVLIVVIGVMVVGLLLGTFVGSSLNDFAQAAPTYQARLKESTIALPRRNITPDKVTIKHTARHDNALMELPESL